MNEKLIQDVELLKSRRIIKKDADIVARTGYNKSTISNYLSDRERASENFLKKFYDEFGTDLQNKVLESKGNIIHVPIKAQAGFMRGYESELYIDTLMHYSLPGIHGQYFSFDVDDFSMHLPGHELSAKPSDRIFADRQRAEKFEDLVKNKGYILITIEGVAYKQFDHIRDKKAYFNSLNKDYPEYVGNLKDIKAAYYVDFILKKT